MEYVNLSIMPRKLFVLMAMAAGCSLNPIDAMALNAVQITQQANSVKGRILDPTGEPIIGATVKVKGSKTGTVTDLDGNLILMLLQEQCLKLLISDTNHKWLKPLESL